MFDARLGLKNPDKVPDEKLLEDQKNQVFSQHKREASQFDALKRLFGEEVEEGLAISLANDAIAEHKVNNEPGVEGHFEVQNIRFDDVDYMMLTNKDSKKAALVVKKEDPSGKTEKKLQDAVDRAFNEHSRKVSQFRSLEESLKGMFGDEFGPEAAQHIMKSVKPNTVNSEKQSQGTGHRKSVQLEPEDEKEKKTEDIAQRRDNVNQQESKSIPLDNITNPNVKIVFLEKELAIKTEMVARMQLEIEDLRNQKIALLVSANEAMNQLRHGILSCQGKQK